MGSEPKNKIFICMNLTSNTEATENKVQFFNFAYAVKGFQCHRQLFTNPVTYI